jgi:hypothetical protein
VSKKLKKNPWAWSSNSPQLMLRSHIGMAEKSFVWNMNDPYQMEFNKMVGLQVEARGVRVEEMWSMILFQTSALCLEI